MLLKIEKFSSKKVIDLILLPIVYYLSKKKLKIKNPIVYYK